MLVEARGRVEQWPLERDSFDAVAEGLERTYRRGRRDLRAARAEPSVEALHEWRKRVKELWYHHTLLRALWPPVMAAAGDEAHALADRLGDDHDLAVLADWVREYTEAGPELFEEVERRRDALQAGAFELGARLYAEKPSAYVRRLGLLWDAREAIVRAP
jgi:CHAD domain-containing protein